MKQTTAKAQAKTISKTTGRVKGTWGGRRPGAGRKPMCDKAMTETATVRLSVEQVTSFRALGGAIWFRDVLNQAMAADPKLASGVSKPDGLIPVKVKTHVKVPSGYSAVQAGFPSPAEQYQGESIDFNDLLITNAASTFVLKAKGESMIEAGIDEGDLLVVDRSVTEKPGDIVIMQVHNEFTVKRFMKKRGKIYLHPEYSSGLYDDIIPGDGDEWVCFGVVKHVIKSIGSLLFSGAVSGRLLIKRKAAWVIQRIPVSAEKSQEATDKMSPSVFQAAFVVIFV